MLRITRETDYSVLLLTSMVQDQSRDQDQNQNQVDECAHSAASLARHCRLPLPIVSKVLKALVQGGVLASQRGAYGGYHLARPATAISVADIIEAIEGPIAMTECSIDDPHACAYQAHCTVSSHWNRINYAIRETLANISLQEMSDTTFKSDTIPLLQMVQTL